MDRQLPWIVALVTAVFALVIAVLMLHARSREMTRLRQSVAELEAELARMQQHADQALEERDRVQAQLEQLVQERANEVQHRDQLLDEMRAALRSRDVTISELQGRLTVDILDRVLFDLGEAVLREEGQTILRKVASVLAGHPERNVLIIGHTDNLPIRPAAQHRFPSNWELSTARATAAVRFLIEQCGLHPQRLAAMGCGEYQPVADNATPEGRARNRRIEIVVLPPGSHYLFDPAAGAAAPVTPSFARP
ncbi:MAG: OmpA family protein [Verrucomicrobiota bacterium]|nr:OmpA family protein [Limisphaera sp.]MDW8380776.1 OmpA family protein [Verrucomicrobiota bacterium]